MRKLSSQTYDLRYAHDITTDVINFLAMIKEYNFAREC